nr:Chain A, Antimicrobial peptide [Bombina maxima]
GIGGVLLSAGKAALKGLAKVLAEKYAN